MQRDPKIFLSEAQAAIDAIVAFTRDNTFDQYVSRPLLRSAVERQFIVIGEALAQLARLDPVLASQIPDLPRIVAFRNIPVHGYALVDDDQVWSAVQQRLPSLRAKLTELIATM